MPVNEVFTTLQTFLGGYQVNDFTRFGRNYKVTMQAESEFRQDVRDLGLLFVRNEGGAMVPLDTLTTAVPSSGARFLQRYNLYRTAAFSGSPAPGASSGDALRALEETAARVLPVDYGFEWTGQSRQEVEAGNTAVVVLGLSIVVVFLFLAALYESWAVPFAVLLATPFGFLGALIAIKLGGLAFNVYGQIGLVTLIGLSAKNAILIVEFAKLNREKGMPLVESALEAARLRLRPILMTSFAFIMGVVPLMIASGAGAASKVSVGTTVFGGMIAATVADDARGAGLLRPDPGPRRTLWRRTRGGGFRRTRGPCAEHAFVSSRLRLLPLLSVAVAIGALAGGCAIGPDYERPADAMPVEVEQFRSVLSSQQAESFADLGWATAFADPELVEMIRTALESNLDLQIAAARVEEFRGLARVERSRLGPQIAGEVSTSPSALGDEDASYSAGFGLSWELDLFGKLRRANESARALLLASEDNARGVLTTLVARCGGHVVPAARARRGSADHQRHDQEPAGIARARAVLEPQRRRLGHRGAAGRRSARDHACAAARRGTQSRADGEPVAVSARLSRRSHPADTVATRVPGAAARSRSDCLPRCSRGDRTCGKPSSSFTPRPRASVSRSPPASPTSTLG